MNKTRQDVEDLKMQWRDDPCFDLTGCVGFEEFKEELKLYAEQQEAKWADYHRSENEKRRKRDEEEMVRLGISNPSTFRYLKSLENRIQMIEERLYFLKK